MFKQRKFVVPLTLLIVLLPVLQAMPALAFKPYTHSATGDHAWLDATDNGKVTIEGREYTVDPRVVSALQNYRAFYNAGVIGPDGFPDLTYGQSVIHPEQTGAWLRYLYTEAWEAQDDAFYTAAEKQQILAFTYGYLTHAAGDMWAHTLVNQFADGIFPAVGDVLTDIDQAEIAIRHVILEGYIGDATPGFDGNPDRGPAPFGDVSNDSTPGTDFDAPHRFIYRALIDPNAPTPLPDRGPIIGFFLDLRGSLASAASSEPTPPLQAALDSYNDTKESFDDLSEDCNFEDLEDGIHDLVACPLGLLELGFDVVIDSAEAFANFVAGTLAALADVVFDAYLNAWIADIDEGLQHWSELGLATTRALFDAQAYRNTQNDACQFEGSEDSQNRINCEDGIGALDVLFHEADPFINEHLLSMLGAPDFVGGLRQALQDFSDDLAVLGIPFNPIEEALADIQELASEIVKDLIEEAYGIDIDQLKSFLTHPTHWMNVESVSMPLPGIGNVTVDLFQPDDRPQIDAIMGLPANSHVPTNIPGIGQSSRLADSAEFEPSEFAPFMNSVTTAKLLLLSGSELNRVMGDLLAAEERIPSADLVGTYPATDSNGLATNVMIQALSGGPWLRSIDSDHSWRADGMPIFCDQNSPACGAFPGLNPTPRPADYNAGTGQFPVWESCLLRPAFRGLFDDWENGDQQFPDLGDMPSADPSDPAAPVSNLVATGEVTVDGGVTYVTQHHLFTLSSADLVFSDGQIGMQYRYYPDGGTPGEWTAAAPGASFALPPDALDGVWHIDFRSEDPCHTFSEADSLEPETIQTFSFTLDTYPEVDVPVLDPAPSNEAQEVSITATFSHPGDPDPHTCMVDFGDGTDPQPGVVVGTTCSISHTFADDNPTGTDSDPYTVAVTVTDDDGDSNTNSVVQTVNNVAPTITGIPTNSPVPQGQLAQITINATDPGAAGDPLTYAFDCDNDGIYDVGPQPENNAICALDPARAFTTINVEVRDDDLGVTTGSVEIKQTLKMCVTSSTGALSQAATNGSCPAGTYAVVLPLEKPATLCINLYTGQPRWQPNGKCTTGNRPHIVPDNGPLRYCRSMWTGQTRIPNIPGQCNTNELSGVIPGVIQP